jgi:hypothetical protein
MDDIIIAQLSKLSRRNIEKLYSICKEMMSERMMGGAAKILRDHISSAAVAMFRRDHDTVAVVLYTTAANGTSDVYVHIAVTQPDLQQRGICRMLLAQLLVEYTECVAMHLESAVDMVDIWTEHFGFQSSVSKSITAVRMHSVFANSIWLTTHGDSDRERHYFSAKSKLNLDIWKISAASSEVLCTQVECANKASGRGSS